ncbi:putative NADH dehydrogenase [Stanieria sp. NIES-3757]|nr:putative NADH dehydrogenase [Stanieria sp. NIES-3757]
MQRTSFPTVLLGGGFVGLFTALHLSQQKYSHPVILIEPRDRFTFKPLLYELLTEEMHSEQVCPSYLDLLANSKVSWIQNTVKSINLHQRQITLDSGETYSYGNLVLALGSRTTYFNIPGAAENALPFTSDTEALTLKMRLKDCLETAITTNDLEHRQHLLTVAIIGAGPAGVELAATLADILPVWYDMMGGDYEEIRVVLVNRSEEILKGDINSSLRQTAQKSLGDRTAQVELLLNAAVTKITPMGIEYSHNGKANFLSAMTICWTGGTQPNSLLQELPVQKNPRGQLLVNPTLQLPDFPEVFVGGDCAYVSDEPQPLTAQVAYQQGKAIAYNLQALAQRRSLVSAKVSLRGTLMKLGIDEGVANIFDRVKVKGELGHLIRQATYLELLPKPIYNFKATTEWLTDELLQRHQPMSLHRQGRTPLVAGMSTILVSTLIAVPLIWRAAQPQQFQTQMSDTSIPTLLDNVTKSEKPEMCKDTKMKMLCW